MLNGNNIWKNVEVYQSGKIPALLTGDYTDTHQAKQGCSHNSDCRNSVQADPAPGPWLEPVLGEQLPALAILKNTCRRISWRILQNVIRFY